MAQNKEWVLREVSGKLAEKLSKKPTEAVDILRRFRKLEEHRLRIWHYSGGGGREVCRRRSSVTDILFRRLFETVAEEAGYIDEKKSMVVVAFGGYGRRELNPASDVDIMFILNTKNPTPQQEEIIRDVTTALWDIGFKVGHSTRSIAQSIKLANEDMVTKTSMLECRYLAGEREVFNAFKTKFGSDCVRGKQAEYIAWRLANQVELQNKYGNSVFLQEPNIKSGCGGMRDYQSLLWLAYFKEGLGTLAKLVEKKILREPERISLEKAYDFLLRVRTETNYINNRTSDHLTLQLQGKIANNLSYPQKNILARCEAFMRDYYQHTLNIHQISDGACEKLKVKKESSLPDFLTFFTGGRNRMVRFDGFYSKNGLLYPESNNIFSDEPLRLIKAFQYMQEKKLSMSTELRSLIARRLQYITREFQYLKTAREIFLSILSHKGDVARILRMMHEAGVLGRYIPEFGALTCLVQHEFFHRYTADEHTLVCLSKLDGVFNEEQAKLAGYRALFQKLEDPATLYLALLLHDTGKAANRRHHEEESAILAQRVARRLQLSPERRKSLIFLVDSHMALSSTAQKRNLDDPSTIVQFAGIVQTRSNLDALMLLTLADGMGTSDQNWSDWKENLVWQLYNETGRYLETGPSYFEQQKRSRTDLLTKVSKLLPEDFRDEISAHFQFMPERYFSTFQEEQIDEHIKHFREFFQCLLNNKGPALSPLIRWIPHPEKGHSEVRICGWDRTGLLTRIAGAFLSTEMNILSADAFTRGDNLAIDIFRVCDRNHQPITAKRDIARMEATLNESLRHESFDFRPLLPKPRLVKPYRLSEDVEIPIRIVIENDIHPIYSLIDIQTADRLGLLYDLLRCLSDNGINIEFSRIVTDRGLAADTFYVTGKHGEKIFDTATINRLQKQLHKAATGDY
ncbi:MAG: [protein-PII] uridylyltransferase [Chthoniobacterales bacterium]